MDKFNFTSLCSTTAEIGNTFLSSVWTHVQTVPSYYWLIAVGLGGYAVARFSHKRTSTRKNTARKTLLKRLQALKGRIYFRLFNGVHKEKVPIPSDDVLVNSGNVKSLAHRMKRRKDTDEQKLHNL